MPHSTQVGREAADDDDDELASVRTIAEISRSPFELARGYAPQLGLRSVRRPHIAATCLTSLKQIFFFQSKLIDTIYAKSHAEAELLEYLADAECLRMSMFGEPKRASLAPPPPPSTSSTATTSTNVSVHAAAQQTQPYEDALGFATTYSPSPLSSNGLAPTSHVVCTPDSLSHTSSSSSATFYTSTAAQNGGNAASQPPPPPPPPPPQQQQPPMNGALYHALSSARSSPPRAHSSPNEQQQQTHFASYAPSHSHSPSGYFGASMPATSATAVLSEAHTNGDIKADDVANVSDAGVAAAAAALMSSQCLVGTMGC